MLRAVVVGALLVGACGGALLVGGCGRLPPPAPPRVSKLGLGIATKTLANGLRVVTVRDPAATEVQVTARYRVGSVDDAANPGIAHLVEHLMFQQLFEGQQVFTVLEDTATYFNAFTAFDTTTYIARARPEQLTKLLSIEAFRLEQRCAGLGDDIFTRERAVVINEVEQRDQTSEILGALHATVYPQPHPYRQLIGGTTSTVAEITKQAACDFADRFYAPDNVVVVISGPLGDTDISAATALLADKVSARKGQQPRDVQPTKLSPGQMQVDVPVDDDVLVLSWPLPVAPTLQARVRAIGAAIPRLIDGEIRGSAIALELGDARAPVFAVAVLPADGETINDVGAGTRRALDRLPSVFVESGADNVNDVVFDRLRQGAIYSLYQGLEDGSGRDSTLASYVLAGRDPVDALETELAALRELTHSEAAQLAATYLGANDPTVVTLRARTAKKAGEAVVLKVGRIHDMGPRRTQPDPTLASRPAVGAAQPVPGLRKRVLANGLQVVLLPTSTVPTFDARLVFRVGTADEPAARRGVALLATNTLTWDLHYLNDIFAFIRAGGMRDSDVTADRTTFSVQGLDQNLDVVLAGLRRWVIDGTYDDTAAPYANAMRNATKRFDDDSAITDAWRAALFGPQHPYVRAGIARHTSTALTIDDAEAFRSTYFTPGNATLVIAGHFDAALAERWIDYLFGEWSGRSTPPPLPPIEPQGAAIARAEDVTQVQMRIAMPVHTQARAAQLVLAEMLDEIAHDVRFRLGASYSFDGQLAESRLARFYVIAGYVDAMRVAAAARLVRDRIAELRKDATARAKAFVVARDHVLGQLRSRSGGAAALAKRIETDVSVGRQALSDIATASAVQALVVEDLEPNLADLDLAHATILMNGPDDEVKSAFAALGRTPSFLAPAVASADDVGPGAMVMPFVGEEQHVRRSEVQPALTWQPPPRWFFAVGARGLLASMTEYAQRFSGFGLAGEVGYRLGWNVAVGAYAGYAQLTSAQDYTLSPMELLGFLQYDLSNGWVQAAFGMHADFSDVPDARTNVAPSIALQLGWNLFKVGTHRIGLAVRYDSVYSSDDGYTALSAALWYRH